MERQGITHYTVKVIGPRTHQDCVGSHLIQRSVNPGTIESAVGAEPGAIGAEQFDTGAPAALPGGLQHDDLAGGPREDKEIGVSNDIYRAGHEVSIGDGHVGRLRAAWDTFHCRFAQTGDGHTEDQHQPSSQDGGKLTRPSRGRI